MSEEPEQHAPEDVQPNSFASDLRMRVPERPESKSPPTPEDIARINIKNQQGLRILVAALGLGVIGQTLFHQSAFGLNWGVWIGSLCLALIGIARWNGFALLAHKTAPHGLFALLAHKTAPHGLFALQGEGRWLLIAAFALALCVAWRDSETLGAINTLLGLATLALAALSTRDGSLRVATLTSYFATLITTGFGTLFGGFVLLFSDISWTHLPRRNLPPETFAVLRGALIAAPIVIVFGALFSSADAVFGRFVGSLFNFNWNLDTFMNRLIVTLAFAWIAAGFLHIALQSSGLTKTALKPGGTLGQTEMVIVMGSLNALFTAFVIVQFGYLFGGSNNVTVAGLTYADYARRGFFELVWVAALVLPLLLVLHAFVPKTETATRQRKLYRVLALVLLGLLAIIMISAVQRMRLYQLEYGLTELRLYPTAFMAWLALVFAWFATTVLRERRERFAFGALVAGIGVVFALNAINPDALIVRVNADRVQRGKTFDAEYARTLSADAVPALLEAIRTLPETAMGGNRQQQLEQVIAVFGTQANGMRKYSISNWRAWNWGRWQAHQAIWME
jgi:Domain of unknown function (DUF4173)